ncbi:MAG: 50S ribosomal protein L23 [Pseudomonadota bacterium]|nr:50S ribosomal protein L23 [Pseudomonadota bacterium]
MNPDRLYGVLREPHISEKISVIGERSNQYAFKVARDATKREIKQAVETIFKVSVENVTTINVKGKVKRTFRGLSRAKNWKKAYVRITDGQEIDITEGAT